MFGPFGIFQQQSST